MEQVTEKQESIENSSSESKIKMSLMKYHNANSDKNNRMDISKILEEYQSKFNVPKVLIMKWLDLKLTKSLFENNKFQENLSQSVISQEESEYTASECSPSIRGKSNSPQEEIKMLGDDLEDLKVKTSCSKNLKIHSPTKSQFERRASCLKPNKDKLDVPSFKIKDCPSERDSSSDSSKGEDSDFERETVNQEEKQLVKCQSRSIIKPQFIIKKKKMAGAKLSLPNESTQDLSKGEEEKAKTSRSKLGTKNIKIKFTKPIRHMIARSASKRRGSKQDVPQNSFKDRKTSLPSLNKKDSSTKIIPSYFKASLGKTPRMENLKNSCKKSTREEEKSNFKSWTSKHIPSKARLFNAQVKFSTESSRNEDYSSFSNTNHIYQNSAREGLGKRSINTISVKELLKLGDLEAKNKATSSRLLPELRKSKDLNSKLSSLKKFNLNTAFSPQPTVRKAKLMENDIQNKAFCHLQTLTLDNRRPENLGLTLTSPNSQSTSKLQTFMGNSPFRSRMKSTKLKEISEHQSVSSSREVSLDRIDESKEGIPKQYISLRKSFKENKFKEEQVKLAKSTFKRRRQRSSMTKLNG